MKALQEKILLKSIITSRTLSITANSNKKYMIGLKNFPTSLYVCCRSFKIKKQQQVYGFFWNFQNKN
jgi:hypothetical protein